MVASGRQGAEEEREEMESGSFQGQGVTEI